MPRDHKAEFGYQPTWEKQREKQDEHAENRDARLHGEIEIPDPEDLQNDSED